MRILLKSNPPVMGRGNPPAFFEVDATEATNIERAPRSGRRGPLPPRDRRPKEGHLNKKSRGIAERYRPGFIPRPAPVQIRLPRPKGAKVMNTKVAKKIRKEQRKLHAQYLRQYQVSYKTMPLLRRLKLAWLILRKKPA
jgi:hypothetical protein